MRKITPEPTQASFPSVQWSLTEASLSRAGGWMAGAWGRSGTWPTGPVGQTPPGHCLGVAGHGLQSHAKSGDWQPQGQEKTLPANQRMVSRQTKRARRKRVLRFMGHLVG